MNRNVKKSMSILLILCMLMTFLPFSVLAGSESLPTPPPVPTPEMKTVIVSFVLTDGKDAHIGEPSVKVAKKATHVSAAEAQKALEIALVDEQKDYILANPNATYKITVDKVTKDSKVSVKVKEVKDMTVEAVFKEDKTQLGEKLSIPGVKDYQGKLDETQISFVESHLPKGYILASKQNYTIVKDKKDPLKGTVTVMVKKQIFSTVTVTATPKDAVTGVDAYSIQVGQDIDGKITVTDTCFTAKEGYVLEKIQAYGFDNSNAYREVHVGDKLTPNKDGKYTIRYEYASKTKTADIMLAPYPTEAVKEAKEKNVRFTLDENNSIKVPKATDYFTTAEGYEPAEIYAIGFNGKDSVEEVKAGDIVKVNGASPKLRYQYNKVITTKKVNFLAGPMDAVTGTGALDKELPLDEDGKITVPKESDIFTAKAGYTLKEITATGFNGKDGTVRVEVGDKLLITDKNPVIKYVYEQEAEESVVMEIDSTQMLVNGVIKTTDVAPMIQDSRTYVPIRALSEAFGADVQYINSNRTVIIKLGDTTVTMLIGSKVYTVNGEKHIMDVAPFINGSRTMVPIRFVAEAFGITVTPTYHKDGTTDKVIFTK